MPSTKVKNIDKLERNLIASLEVVGLKVEKSGISRTLYVHDSKTKEYVLTITLLNFRNSKKFVVEWAYGYNPPVSVREECVLAERGWRLPSDFVSISQRHVEAAAARASMAYT